MQGKYQEWSDSSIIEETTVNKGQDQIIRVCDVCWKTDSKTLTLQQCIDCKPYIGRNLTTNIESNVDI